MTLTAHPFTKPADLSVIIDCLVTMYCCGFHSPAQSISDISFLLHHCKFARDTPALAPPSYIGQSACP